MAHELSCATFQAENPGWRLSNFACLRAAACSLFTASFYRPCRGVDSLHASGLLDEEGRQKIARREGLSKREDTTNYHSLGTVCTLRAALAVPVPLHNHIQEEEEEARPAVHRRHWEATEKADGSVFTAKSLGDSPTAVPTQWAPKGTPSRAKVGDVAGPWRRSAEEAAEDRTRSRWSCF
eukprot:s7133_g2.t1